MTFYEAVANTQITEVDKAIILGAIFIILALSAKGGGIMGGRKCGK